MTRRQRRRRCRVCGELYWPNAKTKVRQQVCSSPGCQKRWHQEVDRAWHARHPEYDVARRLQVLKERLQRSGDASKVVRKEVPPVCGLPADEVKEQFGTDGLAILVILARLICGERRGPSRRGQPTEITEEPSFGSAAAAGREDGSTVGNCEVDGQVAVDCGTEGQLDNGARKTRCGDISLKLHGNSATRIPGVARRDIELTRDNRGEIRQLKFGCSQDETAPAAVIGRVSAAAHLCRASGGYGVPQLH